MPDADRHSAAREYVERNRDVLDYGRAQQRHFPVEISCNIDAMVAFADLLTDVDRLTEQVQALTAERDELRARVVSDDEPESARPEPMPNRVLRARIVSRRTRPPLVIEDFDDPDPGQACCEAVDAHLTALTAVADVARREKEASEALDRLPGPAGFANADGEVDLDAYFEVYGHGGKYERLHAAWVEASEALHATVDALDGPGRVEAQYLIEG